MSDAHAPAQDPHAPAHDSHDHGHDDHAQSAERSMMISNILALLGSIILIIIIVWGLIHLFSITDWFSGFSKKSTKIEITAPKEAISGETAQISWKYSTKEKGTYAFLYPCQEGVRLAAPNASGAFYALPCGAAYTLGQATSSLTILPVLSATSSVNIPITVLFMPSATGTTAQGTASIAVSSGSASAPKAVVSQPEKAPEEKPVSTAKPAAAALPADLAVTITGVSVDPYGNGVVTFNISNVGGATAGAYTFTAQLPTSQPYTYVSPSQSPLAPGAYIVNTLRFTQAIPGAIYITVDPYGSVQDMNRANNSASQSIAGGTYYRY